MAAFVPPIARQSDATYQCPAGKRYEYRFVKHKVEADETTKNGYAELLLSYPIWNGFALERQVRTAPEML